MVGKEFNDKAIYGLFAATLPLVVLRLLSWAATTPMKTIGSIAGGRSAERRKHIRIADVPRAFFEVPAKRDVCVALPGVALAEGERLADIAGKLGASLYRTRDASANWQEGLGKPMAKWGFSRYHPCTYMHKERQIRCLVHEDDLVCEGSHENLRCLKEMLKARFEIKETTAGLRPEDGDNQEARILNRVVRITKEV